jgi:hypothetical protein
VDFSPEEEAHAKDQNHSNAHGNCNDRRRKVTLVHAFATRYASGRCRDSGVAGGSSAGCGGCAFAISHGTGGDLVYPYHVVPELLLSTNVGCPCMLSSPVGTSTPRKMFWSAEFDYASIRVDLTAEGLNVRCRARCPDHRKGWDCRGGGSGRQRTIELEGRRRYLEAISPIEYCNPVAE